jgi:hypothetical protein
VRGADEQAATVNGGNRSPSSEAWNVVGEFAALQQTIVSNARLHEGIISGGNPDANA